MRNDVKPEWWAVARDVTSDYSIAEEDKPKIKRILDVFYYDANTYTYCCELAPSYHLRYLYTTIETDLDTLDEDRDRLDEEYCHEPTEDIYMHASDVKSLPADLKVAFGEIADHIDRSDPQEEEDYVRETWQGNCPF